MPDASFDEMIQRYRQELLQLQQRSTALPQPEPSAPLQSPLLEPTESVSESTTLSVAPSCICSNEAYTEFGRLHVQVFTARQAIPLPDADVTVYCTQNDTVHLCYFVKTDQSGYTPLMLLPTPPESLSESPGNVTPYALYGVRVHKSGFIPAEKVYVQVFSGIVSTASFEMVPALVTPALPAGL